MRKNFFVALSAEENRKIYKLWRTEDVNMFPVIFRGHWMTFFGGEM